MLGGRLRDLLAERNLSIAEFAEMCDLPVETVKNVYYGRTNDPKLSTVVKMAEHLEMSINCLIGKCPHTSAEKMIINNYRACGKHGKSIIELVAKYEAGSIKADRESIGKHKIPGIIPHGDVRNGIVYETCESIEIETSVKEAYFAIQMTNNDFAPKFCKGDILLFENRFPHNEEKAAFFKGDRIYIRKFLEEGNQYRLKCLHAYGEDIILKRMDGMEYIGVCVGVVRE